MLKSNADIGPLVWRTVAVAQGKIPLSSPRSVWRCHGQMRTVPHAILPGRVAMPPTGGWAGCLPSMAHLMVLDSGVGQLGATLFIDSGSGRGRSPSV